MTEISGESEHDRAARVDSALAESQRLEREEREADLARQRSADERIVEALSEHRDGQ